MGISYNQEVGSIRAGGLRGFFQGWPNPPSPETHLKILQNSHSVWLAFDGDRCIGFINAISDQVFYTYIPLLEVLPEYQNQGIGTELVKRMVGSLGDMYAIDLACDETLSGFYESHGFLPARAMLKRNYENQSGDS